MRVISLTAALIAIGAAGCSDPAERESAPVETATPTAAASPGAPPASTLSFSELTLQDLRDNDLSAGCWIDVDLDYDGTAEETVAFEWQDTAYIRIDGAVRKLAASTSATALTEGGEARMFEGEGYRLEIWRGSKGTPEGDEGESYAGRATLFNPETSEEVSESGRAVCGA